MEREASALTRESQLVEKEWKTLYWATCNKWRCAGKYAKAKQAGAGQKARNGSELKWHRGFEHLSPHYPAAQLAFKSTIFFPINFL